MGQVAKLKRTWNLASVSQIVQKITENYCTCLYLSTGQIWWLHDLWYLWICKIYSKMHLISCTNTHRDVTDLVNHGMVKNTKTWISWERNIIFLRNKKILNLCFRWHILRSYRFVAELTFKQSSKCVLQQGVLRNFSKFIGKHLCWSVFLMKLQAWGLQRY